MPWFQPNPSAEDLDFWMSRPANFSHQVAQWPHPNTIRVDPKYRLRNGFGKMIALASRFGFIYFNPSAGYRQEDTEQSAFGWWDMEVRGIDHLGVTSDANSEGYTVDINIKAEDDLPVLGVPGIEIVFDLTHPTIGDQQQREERPQFPQSESFKWDQHTNQSQVGMHRHWPITPVPGPTLKACVYFAVSDCYLFPLLPAGFAQMNGIDAYIGLTNNLPSDGGPSFFEADVRLRDNGWAPFLAPSSSSSQIAIFDGEAVYGARRLALPDLPAFGVWFKYRFEFEWSSGLQLNYRAWIDDVLQDEQTRSRVFLTLDNIGVRRLLVGAVWGDFDIKNLIFKRGTFASPVSELDMPLFENALDLSPKENHGTTFNMPLPSV